MKRTYKWAKNHAEGIILGALYPIVLAGIFTTGYLKCQANKEEERPYKIRQEQIENKERDHDTSLTNLIR
ncbi:hypothetical protein KW787_03305 [Candidatus Pacearchaeota archaeon]|nr:hypothetical protein [Candidatus Pacearchaeota archaeon]